MFFFSDHLNLYLKLYLLNFCVRDDFWFEDPNGDPMGVYWLQGVDMIHCSYNSLWQGQFIQPDWDMFQSDHLCAEFHAGSRAICGDPCMSVTKLDAIILIS